MPDASLFRTMGFTMFVSVYTSQSNCSRHYNDMRTHEVHLRSDGGYHVQMCQLTKVAQATVAMHVPNDNCEGLQQQAASTLQPGRVLPVASPCSWVLWPQG